MATKKKRPNRAQYVDENYADYAKAENIDDFKDQQKVKNTKILNNIEIVGPDTKTRYVVIVEQCKTHEKIAISIAEAVYKELQTETFQERTREYRLNAQKVIDAENTLLSYQNTAYLSLLDPDTKRKTFEVRRKICEDKILVATLSVMKTMTETKNAARHYIKCLNVIDWMLKKKQNYNEDTYPHIFDTVCPGENVIGDNENVIIIEQKNEEKTDKEDFAENKVTKYSLKVFIAQTIEKFDLTAIASKNATNYLTEAANSLHIDYMDFAKITVKNIKIMIRDLKIPPNKSDAADYVQHIVKNGSSGIKFAVEWDFCDNFAAEGMCNLVETPEYSRIRDTYLRILKPDIKKRVDVYNANNKK
eukprot:338092_1